jgi:hypothetical protein
MSLHDSPLLHHKALNTSPCRDWLASATSADEYFRLAAALSTIPTTWIEWTEKIVRRGRRTKNPPVNALSYRMSILWNGIILLQETKFLCDITETALRQAILRHCHANQILLGDFYEKIPAWKKTVDRLKLKDAVGPWLLEPISEGLLSNFDFYQTSQIIAVNWNRVCCKQFKIGFGDLFWADAACRDLNLFTKDMQTVRHARNQIAHSRALFQPHETQAIYDIAHRWLSPIDVGIGERVLRYRRDRPDFLDGILIRPPRQVENMFRFMGGLRKAPTGPRGRRPGRTANVIAARERP